MAQITREQARELLQALVQQQPINKDIARLMGNKALRQLLEVIKQLRAQGMAGPHTRAPERLLRLYTLLNQRVPPEREPTADQIIQSLTPKARNQILGQEALLARQSNAQATVTTQKQLAQANNPVIL